MMSSSIRLCSARSPIRRSRLRLKIWRPKLDSTGGPVMGRATAKPTGVGGAYAVAIVDVEVDPDTGKVDILRASIFQDAGESDLSALCGGADAGRRGTGDWLGTQ